MTPDERDDTPTPPAPGHRPRTPDPEAVIPEASYHDEDDLFPPSNPDLGVIGDDNEEVDFGRLATFEEGASAAVPLSQLSGPLSGASIVSWADLMKARALEENRIDDDGSDDNVKFDAASDRDLLRDEGSSRVRLTEPLPGYSGDSANILNVSSLARPPLPPKDEGSSVNLLGAGSVHDDDSDIFSNVRPPTPISDDVFDFPEPVALGSDSGRARPDTLPDISGDDAMFTIEPAAPGPDQSTVLGRNQPPPDSNLWGGSSRVNLLGSLPEFDLADEDLNDTDRVSTPALPRPSAIASISRPGDPSSAVELGTASVIDLPYPLGMDSNAPSGVTRRKTDPDSGKVDLLSTAKDPKGSGVGLSAVVKELAAAKRELSPTTPLPPPSRILAKPAPKAGMPAWASGLLGGGVVAAAGVAAWLSGVTPPPSPLRPGLSNATSKLPPAQAAAIALERGSPAEAAAILAQSDTTTGDVLAVRGQARLLEYVQTRSREKQPLNGDDPGLAAARKDLQDAETAEATLWLGLMEESLQRPDEARRIYTQALSRFTKQPGDQRMFRAALDRLDSAPPKPRQASARPADPAVGLAVFTLLLQAAPDAPPQAAPEEPGFKFWEAMKLAQKGSYPAAKAALKEAREQHDARRKAAPRRGSNPVSDPLEDIFLRSCDELVAYWDAREALQKDGYDPAKGTPAAAIAKAVADRKKAQADVTKAQADAGKSKPTLDAITKSLKDASLPTTDLAASVANVVKGRKDDQAALAKLVTDVKAANQRKAAAESALEEAKLQVSDAMAVAMKYQADLTAAKKQLADAQAAAAPKALTEARATIAKLEAELKTAKATPSAVDAGPLRERVAKLEADLKAANDAMKAAPAAAELAALKANVVKAEEAATAAKADAVKRDSEAKAAQVLADKRAAELKVVQASLTNAERDAAAEQTKAKKLAGDLAAANTKLANAPSPESLRAAEATAQRAQADRDAERVRAESVAQQALETKRVVDGVREKLVAARLLPPEAGATDVPRGVDAALTAAASGTAVPVASADALRVLGQAKADKFFAAGLEQYSAGDFAGAEGQFRQAIQTFGRDARAHYFLGLCQWRQGRTADAGASLSKGADLELQLSPAPAVIDALLERVQGDARQALSRYRP